MTLAPARERGIGCKVQGSGRKGGKMFYLKEFAFGCLVELRNYLRSSSYQRGKYLKLQHIRQSTTDNHQPSTINHQLAITKKAPHRDAFSFIVNAAAYAFKASTLMSSSLSMSLSMFSIPLFKVNVDEGQPLQAP